MVHHNPAWVCIVSVEVIQSNGHTFTDSKLPVYNLSLLYVSSQRRPPVLTPYSTRTISHPTFMSICQESLQRWSPACPPGEKWAKVNVEGAGYSLWAAYSGAEMSFERTHKLYHTTARPVINQKDYANLRFLCHWQCQWWPLWISTTLTPTCPRGTACPILWQSLRSGKSYGPIWVIFLEISVNIVNINEAAIGACKCSTGLRHNRLLSMLYPAFPKSSSPHDLLNGIFSNQQTSKFFLMLIAIGWPWLLTKQH